jgi:hypothetical protein
VPLRRNPPVGVPLQVLQTTNDETKQNSVDVILDKFYEISN